MKTYIISQVLCEFAWIHLKTIERTNGRYIIKWRIHRLYNCFSQRKLRDKLGTMGAFIYRYGHVERKVLWGEYDANSNIESVILAPFVTNTPASNEIAKVLLCFWLCVWLLFVTEVVDNLAISVLRRASFLWHRTKSVCADTLIQSLNFLIYIMLLHYNFLLKM